MMIKNVIAFDSLDLAQKRVLIRQDLNVPLKGEKISSDARILAALPTIKKALSQNAKVILMSHLGRPSAGQFDESCSLQPVAKRLSELLNQPVRLQRDWLSGVQLEAGNVVLCENVRFQKGETENDKQLGEQMAKLCDVFVMDAFGTAHRAHASTYGVAKYAPVACAGPLLLAELDALERALAQPKKPVVAIVGGAKVSSKLSVLESLVRQVDYLIVGGGIANTFIAAQGFNVGKSLFEATLIPTAKKLLKQTQCQIPLPCDVVVGKDFSENTPAETKVLSALGDDDMIFDIGFESTQQLNALIAKAATIIWNGPVGVFELTPFSQGTKALAHAIAKSDAFSLAGGGDTIAAIDCYGVASDISYISTGGGAFLALLEGKTLPAIEALIKAKEKLNVKTD